MDGYIIFIFLLTILQSFLFYSKSLGLNVILFMIPLLVFLVIVLKNNNKIKNKKGLLFIIPIILLSISYLIYDNSFTKAFNVLVIPSLLILMYIYTVKPTNSLTKLIENGVKLIFEPFNCIEKLYNIVGMKLNSLIKLSDQNKKVIKSLFIVVPIVIVVLLLLSSADMIFNNIFKNFFNLFKDIKIDNIIGRVVVMIIFFTYLGSVINYLIFDFKDNKEEKSKEFKIESFTIKLLLTSLNIIYILFDFIQIKSLMLHKVAENINYAQYARSGFFQLMAISLINITIILISKHSKEENKYARIMSIAMVLLTLIIIISSALRMHMYESAYGYTLLRLLVYASLATEVVLLIPTVIYIINSKTNILKCYMVIIVTAYTIISLSPLNYIIANNNINRYYETKKIDIDYLENFDSDNVLLLKELYDRTDNQELKNTIKAYFETNDFYTTKGFQEYNISKHKAQTIIKNINK